MLENTRCDVEENCEDDQHRGEVYDLAGLCKHHVDEAFVFGELGFGVGDVGIAVVDLLFVYHLVVLGHRGWRVMKFLEVCRCVVIGGE